MALASLASSCLRMVLLGEMDRIKRHARCGEAAAAGQRQACNHLGAVLVVERQAGRRCWQVNATIALCGGDSEGRQQRHRGRE